MSKLTAPIPVEVRRGPVEHERRDQIVEAASRHFRQNGYNKTSVAELAQAIGVSSAYIYRFFDSKQSIGEAVCAATLAGLAQELIRIADLDITAAAKMRQFFCVVLNEGHARFIKERKMHELVANAVSGDWESVRNHRKVMRAVLQQIVVQGRGAGEFERKTPIDEVVTAIAMALIPYAHPALVEQRGLEDLQTGVRATTNLVLRSLAP